jgi:hypothetical protein
VVRMRDEGPPLHQEQLAKAAYAATLDVTGLLMQQACSHGSCTTHSNNT